MPILVALINEMTKTADDSRGKEMYKSVENQQDPTYVNIVVDANIRKYYCYMYTVLRM